MVVRAVAPGHPLALPYAAVAKREEISAANNRAQLLRAFRADPIP